jgi:hypothetical protein
MQVIGTVLAVRVSLTSGLVAIFVAVCMFAGPIASSGAWTLEETSGGLSAVGGEGEGTHLENGVGIAPGAIIPNPPDIQAQEELVVYLAQKAEREVAEQEAVQQVAAEREEAAEREAAQRATAEHEAAILASIRCVVPSLEGESLAAARRSLHSAHCTLGRVDRPRKVHGDLVVKAQSPGYGKKLANEAAIEVRLGLAKRPGV